MPSAMRGTLRALVVAVRTRGGVVRHVRRATERALQRMPWPRADALLTGRVEAADRLCAI